MRFDTAGLFWDDTPPPRPPKVEKEKCVPPPRTWEEPGYLPYLDEARRFHELVNFFTWEELEAARLAREVLIYDSEVYGNYFLAAFTSVVSGKVIYFEAIGADGQLSELDRSRLRWIFDNFTTVGFNSDDFDLPEAALALEGYSCAQLKYAANQLIQERLKPWLMLKVRRVKKLRVDHIDLIEVAPLQASLKIYGGRLHVPRIQELPFKHDTILNEDQLAIVRWYCIGSDLTATAFLYMELKPQIELRASMGQMYGVDLRSKSDAQIAEAVLSAELQRRTYQRPARPGEIPEGWSFQYKVPDYIQFEDAGLKAALEVIRNATFKLGDNGSPVMPEEVAALQIRIGDATYQMGIGGLHSMEKNSVYIADDEHALVDRDVTSYYPQIILNQKLYPEHLGPAFLDVFRELVERRKLAKITGNKVESDTIKIVVNGTFGKTGSPWSILYSPDLMTQVTISGQLSLLMLIERLHAWGTGALVCSANTDGVLLRYHKSKEPMVAAIIAEWERVTGFGTEETQYRAVLARDVNNYFAIKVAGKKSGRFLDEKLGVKTKGVYCERGSAGDSVLSKNPQSLICNDAVMNFLVLGKPLGETIRECKDVRRFVSVQTVQGGAVSSEGEYLGKALRYYYAAGVTAHFIRADSGAQVSNSEGARACLQLPREVPADVDFAKYEADALEILREIGYPMPEPATV
jgi:hypothetical protein